MLVITLYTSAEQQSDVDYHYSWKLKSQARKRQIFYQKTGRIHKFIANSIQGQQAELVL